ncbi:Protein SENSITIVE TO UV 2 [Linum perenne]
MSGEKVDEGFDDWDDAFVDELLQVEEVVALTGSSASSSSKPKPYHLQPPPPPPPFRAGDGVSSVISYSPPRELTQRPLVLEKSDRNGSSSSPQKEDEIRRLKTELERRSKQLAQMEHECSELKKERIKNHEQVERSRSRGDVNSSKARNLHGKGHDMDAQHDYFKSENNEPLEDLRRERLASSSRAVGIQTDKDDDPNRGDANHGASSSSVRLHEKLLSIWGCTSDEQSGRNLISKLLMACTEEFRVLFGTMSLTATSASVSNHVHGFCPSDATKVSELYNVMIKVSNGLLKVEALFGPLLDLCGVENVEILHSCLCILHVLLKHLLSLGSKPGRRNNVKLERLNCDGSSKEMDLFNAIQESYAGLPDSSTVSSSVSCVNWHSLFELMLQIAMDNSNERVRLEAISVMNMIVSRSNASVEREKYGSRTVLQSITQFLKREAGFSVQKGAVHLLFLLLNCPKILNSFCSGCHEELTIAAKGEKPVSISYVYSFVLSGLAECIPCSGNSVQEIELCKRAIATLAFLAASEKSGYEILVGHRVSGGANFLMLILQELASERSLEGSDSAESVEKVRARTKLIREALILLNRLVSNPGSSAIVLRVLTGTRDMASLTIEVASRLSSNEQTSNHHGRTAGESETLELAKKFKKRVFAYLGSMVA